MDTTQTQDEQPKKVRRPRKPRAETTGAGSTPKEEEVPAEIIDALRIITGNRPESFVQEFTVSTKKDPMPGAKGAGFGGTSAQEEFVKKKDPVEEKIRFTKNKIYVFDLTDESERLAYNEIMDVVFNPEESVDLAEMPKEPNIMIDPAAPKGYRAIVVVKTTKPIKYLKAKGTGYKVARKASQEEAK